MSTLKICKELLDLDESARNEMQLAMSFSKTLTAVPENQKESL